MEMQHGHPDDRQFHPVYGLANTIGAGTAEGAVAMVTLGMGPVTEMPRYNSVWSRTEVATTAAGVCIQDSMGIFDNNSPEHDYSLSAPTRSREETARVIAMLSRKSSQFPQYSPTTSMISSGN